MKNKIFGVALLVLAVLIIIGLVIEKTGYWFLVDYVAIAVCAISGISLVLEKK